MGSLSGVQQDDLNKKRHLEAINKHMEMELMSGLGCPQK